MYEVSSSGTLAMSRLLGQVQLSAGHWLTMKPQNLKLRQQTGLILIYNLKAVTKKTKAAQWQQRKKEIVAAPSHR